MEPFLGHRVHKTGIIPGECVEMKDSFPDTYKVHGGKCPTRYLTDQRAVMATAHVEPR